jgi:hypothetical protein
MNSTELLAEIAKQLKELEHKEYDGRSFRSGYLIGYAKALTEVNKLINNK